MKNWIRTSLSLVVLALFVFLNWATSEEETFVDFQAEATLENTHIVLRNLDDIPIQEGVLTISTSVLNDQEYIIGNYNLAVNGVDTLPLQSFTLTSDPNSMMYPDTIPPEMFSIYFAIPENNAFAGYQVSF